ncbi:MAG: gamma-glutamyl-gamma-aminobutyrate hydrolase family protein [Thaumarchaeota archaeon]|nr:gamma-glutamyl-gamma-aminobutyrate hydrolase family protein [Nitrososphaerota archaeon]
MSDILVIQNAKHEGLSNLGKLLEEDGFKTSIIFAKKEKIPEINHSGVVILGAPESANDDLLYLKEEMKLIRNTVKKEIPLLGICLGSQLIAKSFDAKVYSGHKKEIGIYYDIEFDNIASGLFSGIKSPATVFHWHGDTFDLPPNSTRLAHSKDYQNQAFQIGSAVGVQFHLEVDEETIRLWLEKSKNELSKTPYIDPREIIRKLPENTETIQNNMKIFYQNFKSKFNL